MGRAHVDRLSGHSIDPTLRRAAATDHKRVRVVPFAEYQAWDDREAQDIVTARREAARQRDELLKAQQEAEQQSE